jgi:hypothetical protein
MSAEPQFLSFKGLKHYTPEDGWGQVHNLPPPLAPAAKAIASAPAKPENVPTLTDTLEDAPVQSNHPLADPSMESLFDQLRAVPNDSLSHTWRTVAAEVNLLTQRMALQRELKERLRQLDQDLVNLRSTILLHLREVEQAAEQQLHSARHRAETSALAQSKLAAKLNADR